MKEVVAFSGNASPLRRECIIALGGIVKDATVKALEAEAVRRKVSAVSTDDIAFIVVPSWLYDALLHVEARTVPSILGRPVSAAVDKLATDEIVVHFSVLSIFSS